MYWATHVYGQEGPGNTTANGQVSQALKELQQSLSALTDRVANNEQGLTNLTDRVANNEQGLTDLTDRVEQGLTELADWVDHRLFNLTDWAAHNELSLTDLSCQLGDCTCDALRELESDVDLLGDDLNYLRIVVQQQLGERDAQEFTLVLYFFKKIYLSTFIAHYPRVSSKRFTLTLTLLAMLPG
jgi:hypothetical protein